MIIFAYIIPLFILFLIIYASIKKVNVFVSFVSGAKQSISVVFQIFPYITAVFFMTELIKLSGLNNAITDLFAGFFNFLGIDATLCELIILKPVSGSSSLAMLGDIFKNFGADSYISRCACVIFGSSETTFYIASVYFGNIKNKKITISIIISLFCTLFSSLFACLICKFI